MDFQKLYPYYEKKAFRILLKAFRDFSKKIPFEFLTPDNAQNVISITIKQSNLEKALFKVHYMIGNEAGRLQLKEFQRYEMELKKIKPSSYPLFSKAFQTWLVDYYSKFGGENIKLLTETYVTAVVSEIKKSTDENETLEKMRNRIMKAVNSPNFYNWQAMRIARTETTFAVNAGTEISGDFTVITMNKRWMSMRDGRERTSHLEADNQIIGKDELFIVGGEKLRYPGDKLNGASASNLVNCYMPGTLISSKILGGQRSFYSGEAVEIITRSGNRLSVTPNHYILSEDGFIKAKHIQVGDNLFSNKINKNRFIRLVNNYIDKKFFRVENVFSSLNKFWSSENRLIGGLDFDKDGEFMNGNVDVVYPEVELIKSWKSIFDKFIDYFSLIFPSFKSVFIGRLRPFKLFSSRNNPAYARLVSLLYLAFPSCFIHLRPLNSFALGLGSKINIQRFKSGSDGSSCDSEFLRQLIDTHSSVIKLDDVVDVRYFNFNGHVYDFTSYSGVNITNNIYTSNCRCQRTFVPKKDEDGTYVLNI